MSTSQYGTRHETCVRCGMKATITYSMSAFCGRSRTPQEASGIGTVRSCRTRPAKASCVYRWKKWRKRSMDKYKFIRSLRHYPLTRQQIKTLRGQALSGDVAGAIKGLRKCIESNRAMA